MKTRFNTYDIVCAVTELQRLVGLRVNQIYDIDNKTYLIRLGGGESKVTLLIESGTRFHTTAFEWPKNMAPSGFSMKLRKHLKNKRLEKLQQLGADRIVDFQFGIGDAAYHILLELYDRGNVILTDHTFTILYILRPHFEGEEVRFAMREKYPLNRAKEASPLPSAASLKAVLLTASPGDNLRRLLMPMLDCGPAVLDHVLTKNGLNNVEVVQQVEEESQVKNIDISNNKKTKWSKKQNQQNKGSTRLFEMEKDLPVLMEAIQETVELINVARSNVAKGYIIQKQEEKPLSDDKNEHFYQNIEYHPYLFAQFGGQPVTVFDSFLLAVDEFYSTLEGQKIDMRTLQQEREALKKLSNVKKDHAKRLEDLTKAQEGDREKADLISCNQALVDNAILAIRSSIANQMSWPDILELVKAAQANGDPVAGAIKQLKLEVNHISLSLADPYRSAGSSEDEVIDDSKQSSKKKSKQAFAQVVDVDLAMSAWANARKYYDQKRTAAQKERKTLDASQKALKSAERKTQQTLKDVRTISTISKARRVYWFEKFYWFVSSENYLVVGGRDAQQNELIVKRYMRPFDIYVHAEIQGASSVVIRNPGGSEVPPKTLLEAGTMAISYSVAWDAKVVTNAYWVRSDQVSKTAPTGEYLGTGSFMVRGKKNFLPSCHLIMGLSLLFKLEDSFIEGHRGERKVRTFEEDQEHIERRLQEVVIENERLEAVAECVEVDLEAADYAHDEIKQEIGENDEDSGNEKKGQDYNDNFKQLQTSTNFPDTQVKIEHDTGRITIGPVSTSELAVNDFNQSASKADKLYTADEETIIPAAPSRKKQQQNAKKSKEERGRKVQTQQQQENTITDQQARNNSSQIKRGQKGKLKKIRSKYKDQDEEERELRMQILKSSGKDKIGNDDAKLNEVVETSLCDTKSKSEQLEPEKQQQQEQLDVDDGADDMPAGADVQMLDSLTGQPFDDDELLFVIPVVAPYQSLQNYKFKVKLTPGTGKRGRAAKTALTMFSKDKNCGAREKDLLKSIKEETLARNIPGKVKLSAPQLQKFKK